MNKSKTGKTVFEKEVGAVIRRYLEKHEGNLTQAAAELGIAIPTARKLARRAGIWPQLKKAA